MKHQRPNILYIMSDDHTTQAIGAYNSRLAPLNPTPTIDRLFHEGIVFERTYCVNAICTSSRANIMTGQHCQRNGVLDLYDELPVERQHLSREMRQAGYTTAVFGKWHLKQSPDIFDDYCVLPGQAGVRNGWLIDNTDFAPTMLELAGVETPEYMQGRSFAGALYGKEKPGDWRTAIYYRYWMHMAHALNVPGHLGLRTERYKLVFFYGGDFTDVHNGEKRTDRGGNRYYPDTPVAWELYDLQEDPAEMVNQYGNPAYAPVVAGLKQQLRDLRESLDETDVRYPRIQKILDEHWDDQAAGRHREPALVGA